MEEKKQVANINFFKKVWYSITKFEKYPEMASEGLNRAIKYLIILTAFVTIFASIGSLLKMKDLVEEMAMYIEDNIPEFTYADNNITMDISEPIIIENVQYNNIDKIVINPLAETDEQKEVSEKENIINGTTMFFFKNQIVLNTKTEEGETNRAPYTYNDFIQSYTGEKIESFDKAGLTQYLVSEKMNSFYVRYTMAAFMTFIFAYIMVALVDTLEIAILGWITAITARIKMRFLAIFNMAAYSLTLSMILNILYIAINYFTDFTISYFQVAYITIAYIYLAATIFIIKDDIIKKMQEVEKIKQEQKKVREEIKEQEEKKKEEKKKEEKPKNKEEEKNKNENQGEEPQGSEA